MKKGFKKMREAGLKVWRLYLWFFMLADVFVFFSGILVSYAINILTTSGISEYQKWATILWIIASLFLIVMTMIVKPNQEEYKTQGGGGPLKWDEVLKPVTKFLLTAIFLITVTLIVVGALLYSGKI